MYGVTHGDHLSAHRPEDPFFFGLDNWKKLKSIKLPFGYIGIDWFEEADQFAGEAGIRNVKTVHAARRREFAMTFLSFNPPAAARNWAKPVCAGNGAGQDRTPQYHLTTPRDWLGQRIFR